MLEKLNSFGIHLWHALSPWTRKSVVRKQVGFVFQGSSFGCVWSYGLLLTVCEKTQTCLIGVSKWSTMLACPKGVFLVFLGYKEGSGIESSLPGGNHLCLPPCDRCTPLVLSAEELFKREEICYFHFSCWSLSYIKMSWWHIRKWSALAEPLWKENLYAVKCCQ